MGNCIISKSINKENKGKFKNKGKLNIDEL